MYRVMCPKGAGRMANSVNPDQTALLGAVSSGLQLFALTCLSENLGSPGNKLGCDWRSSLST